jgi:hypothetical protein
MSWAFFLNEGSAGNSMKEVVRLTVEAENVDPMRTNFGTVHPHRILRSWY